MPRIDHLERLTQPAGGGPGQVRSNSHKVGLVLGRWLACLVEEDDLWAKEGNAISLCPNFIEGSRDALVSTEDPV